MFQFILGTYQESGLYLRILKKKKCRNPLQFEDMIAIIANLCFFNIKKISFFFDKAKYKPTQYRRNNRNKSILNKYTQK